MSQSCTISPRIKNKNGQIVDSKLWRELRSVAPYPKAREAYLTVKGEEFIEKYGSSSKIQYDENGEPTYDSIVNLREFAKIIDIDTRISSEKRKLKSNETLDATRDNIDKLDDVAIDYNDSAVRDKNFVATTEIFTDDAGKEKVRIDITKSGSRTSDKVRAMVNKRRLNRKLRSMFAGWGVHVDVLSELQQKIRRIAGVTDFESSVVAANGIANTIFVARGKKGLDALPEEFSHFAIEAMHDSPIIKRLYTLVLDNNLAETILGDEYDRYKKEYEQQLTDDEFVGYKKVFADEANRGETVVEHSELDKMLAYEAIGHLVYERILAAENIVQPAEVSTNVANLVSRLKVQFNNTVSKFDAEEILAAINEATTLSSEFANALMRGEYDEYVSTENIATTARFYQLENDITDKKKLLEKLIANSRKRYRILRNNEESFDKEKEKKLIRDLEENYVHQEYEAGIMDWAAASLEQIRVLSEQLDTVKDADSMPMNRRTQILRNIRNYQKSFSIAMKSINYAKDTGILEPSEGRDKLLTELSELTRQLGSNYQRNSTPIFVEIIKEFVGDGITIPYGKMRGHTYTAEELAREADRDISWADAWLDSVAESGDWVLKMMDNIAKKQKSKARLDTIEIKKQLQGAYNKLKNAGYSDTEFMYDKDAVDSKGKPAYKFIKPEQAERLSNAQRDYYYTIMSIKAKLDSYLPNGTTELLNAPAIRKSYLERLSDALKQGDFGQAWESTVESIKDNFLRRADDSEFGGANEDFEGNPIQSLPIYFINNADKLADLSTDVSSTMLMYAKMANDYHHMSESVYTLEFMRDNMRERAVLPGKNNTDNPKKYDDNDLAADENKLSKTNIGKRLDTWFSGQVYGRYMNDKTIGDSNVTYTKVANSLNQLTALNKFAFNILSGLSNVLTGSVMMRIESIAGQWFSYKDVVKADTTFWGQMTSYLKDIGVDNKTSKLALFDEMFNVMQEYEGDVASKDMQRGRMGHLLQSNSLYFINNAGELWMQNRTALALANNYKMKDANNNTISLWDALEVRMDENGVGHLEFKDGVTKLDGTKFSFEDITKFTNKSKAINQRMHGIYNYEDRSAAQATAVGKLALMFRKWIKTSMNRRYGSARYNFDLGEFEEGYYRTVGNFFKQVFKDAQSHQFQIMTRFRELDEYQRQNFTRAFTEVAHLILLTFAFSLLKGLGDDDDDEDYTDTWAFQQLKYQTKRLHTEIAAMTPGKGMPKEAWNIIKSPAAAVNTAQGIMNTLQLVNPLQIGETYFTRVESGRYRGRTKAYKLIMDSPFIPFKETIRRGLNPKEQISYYQ